MASNQSVLPFGSQHKTKQHLQKEVIMKLLELSYKVRKPEK
jgi:hypothetical protein